MQKESRQESIMSRKNKNLEEIDRVSGVLNVLIAELHKEMEFNEQSETGNVSAPKLFRLLWDYFFQLSPLCVASVDMYANGSNPLISIAEKQRIVMSNLARIHELFSESSPGSEESRELIAELYEICSVLCEKHMPRFRAYWIETSEEEKTKSGLAIAVNLTNHNSMER